MVNTQNLLYRLPAFDNCTIAVIGDLMLDEYLWGHIERISPEAPVPILSVVRRESTLGGAGNVAENLRSLGVHVTVFGVVGKDDTGKEIRDLLRANGADVRGVVTDPNRKSTRKARLMSLEHGQQVFRLDEESTQAVSARIEDSLIHMIRMAANGVQLILCSDYMKGVLTERVLSSAFEAARGSGIASVVAPKDSNRQKYCGASILMPNSRELAQLTDTRVDGEVWLKDSSQQLLDRMGLEALVVTRGSDGMSLFDYVEGTLRRVDIPTMARSVYDVTGAGDTAIAAFSAAVASGLDRESAANLANFAAGIKVGKRGTASVSLAELKNYITEQNCMRPELARQASVEAGPSMAKTAAVHTDIS